MLLSGGLPSCQPVNMPHGVSHAWKQQKTQHRGHLDLKPRKKKHLTPNGIGKKYLPDHLTRGHVKFSHHKAELPPFQLSTLWSNFPPFGPTFHPLVQLSTLWSNFPSFGPTFHPLAISAFTNHQKLNGTESQRTPVKSKLRDRAIRYSGFFGVRETWVLWVRFLGYKGFEFCLFFLRIPTLHYGSASSKCVEVRCQSPNHTADSQSPSLREISELWVSDPFQKRFTNLQGGARKNIVISGILFITPISRVIYITPVTQLSSSIYRGPTTLLITIGSGPTLYLHPIIH